MKTVYLVTEKSFFTENGKDYPVEVDEMNDIEIFKNFDDAMDFYNAKCNEICQAHNGQQTIICFGATNVTEIKYKNPKFGGPASFRIYVKMFSKNVK